MVGIYLIMFMGDLVGGSQDNESVELPQITELFLKNQINKKARGKYEKISTAQRGKFYKANLHAHSTQSDGRQTPEELKARYKENGYSIFALSDHDFFALQR